MSNRKPKVYVKGMYNPKGKVINNKSVFEMGFKLEDFYQWGLQHVDEKGIVRITAWELDEPDKYGGTHNVFLNEWKPTPQAGSPSSRSEQDDDLPFR